MSKILRPRTTTLDLDTTELNDAQIRLIKTVNEHLVTILSTDHEDEYFEHTNELFLTLSNLIKIANFITIYDDHTAIPYATQALEYVVENLEEAIATPELTKYDN